MSLLELVIPPQSKALTSVLTLTEELGEAIDPTLATRLIDEASERIYAALDRTLYRAQFKETLQGTGRRRLMLARYPVVSLEQVSQFGSALSLADYRIESESSGFLDCATGFTRTSDPLEWEVIYTAGYFLSGTNLSNFDVSVDGTLETFDSAGSLFPNLLRAGDTVNATAGVLAANQGNHTLTAATTAALTTTSDLTTEVEVASTILIENVPDIYERACLDLAKSTYQTMTLPSNIESVKSGDVTIQFTEASIQKSVGALIGAGLR